MKNNIAFLNLSTGNAFISPFTKKKSKKCELTRKKPFIVINTDYDYGVLMKELVKRAKQLGLEQQCKSFRQKSIKSIKYGEFLVFGDAPLFVDFDYRVEIDKKVFSGYDGRKWKVYDLSTEFHKIIARLEEYAKANREICTPYRQQSTRINVSLVAGNSTLESAACSGCPLVNNNLSRDIDGIDTYTFDKLIGKRSIIDYQPTTNFTIEDVSIHHRWVKIGYRSFTILYDNSQRRYIVVDGTRYYIRKNRFGNEYLTL